MIVIDKSRIDKTELSLGEVLFLIALQNEIVFTSRDIEESLLKRGLINHLYGTVDGEHQIVGYVITRKGFSEIDNFNAWMPVVEDKLIEKLKEEKLLELAEKMRLLWPEGIKPGSSKSWRESAKMVVVRLNTFFKKYGEYPFEDILQAAQNYVEGFNGSTKFMQTLRYFIFKEKRGAGGDRESESQLLNYLDALHEGSGSNQEEDWRSVVV